MKQVGVLRRSDRCHFDAELVVKTGLVRLQGSRSQAGGRISGLGFGI